MNNRSIIYYVRMQDQQVYFVSDKVIIYKKKAIISQMSFGNNFNFNKRTLTLLYSNTKYNCLVF